MLNDEQRAKLVEAAGSLSGVSEPPSETLSVDATNGVVSGDDVKVESVEVDTSAPKGDVELGSPQETDDSPSGKKGHAVPYSRFKSVLEGRNKFRTEVQDYKSKISSLEEKLANLQAQSVTPSPEVPVESENWLDNFLGQEEQGDVQDWQRSYQGLEERLYKFEVAQEEDSLRSELADIEKVYPDVPQQVLLQAVINDPKVDMKAVAEEYHAYHSHIEERAIARYLESQEGRAEDFRQVSTTPRPKSVSSSTGGSVIVPDTKPKSIRDASSALRDLLKKDNIFRD